MKILIVLTSHDQMGDTDRKTGFWLEEFATPYYIFKDAASEITLTSPAGGQPPLDPTSELPEYQSNATLRLKDDAEVQQMLAHTTKLSDIKINDYDALFYPGGHGPLWDLAEDAISNTFIENMYAAGKPVAAVCHGPCVFQYAKKLDGSSIVNGKRVTSFTNAEEQAVGLTSTVPFLVEDMLCEKGGVFTHADNFSRNLAVDGNLITGQNPASSAAVAQAILSQ